MARFDELLGQLQNPGEDELPPTIYDDLLNEYRTVMDGSAEIISKKEEMINSLTSEVSRLKSNNYDLLTQLPAESGENNDRGEEDNAVTIDSIFTKRR